MLRELIKGSNVRQLLRDREGFLLTDKESIKVKSKDYFNEFLNVEEGEMDEADVHN